MAVERSAFEELLETFATPDDRKAFEDLSAKNPKVKEFGMRQSDYNRQLDAVRDKISELETWREWRKNNWDDDGNMTKAEKNRLEQIQALEREKQELESKINLGEDNMTLEQLETWGKDWVNKNKIVTEKELGEKEKQFETYVKGLNQFTAQASLTVPYLNAKHEKEFGEMFDPDEFVKEAVSKNRYDLKPFYEEWVSAKRTTKIKSDYEAEKQQLTEKLTRESDAKVAEAKAEAERLRGMGAGGQNPSDIDSPTMGAFQKKVLKLDQVDDKSKAPEVPLGEGGIAAFAAREFVNKQTSRAS